MSEPSLRKVPLNGTNENEHIQSRRSYLVRVHGRWCAGHFSRQWYGWNFDNWGTAGIQLDMIGAVYEIVTS